MKYLIMTINVKNNVKTNLAWDLNIWNNSFYCSPWEWRIFPENNFFVTFEEKNNEKKVVKRMICKISNRQWDKFNIEEYSAENCVQDDTEKPKNYTKNNLNFKSWAEINIYFTTGMYEYLRDKNLEKSQNLSDLKDKQQARNNLDVYQKRDVYTKNETDWRFVNISWDEEITWKKKFSDLTNFEWWISISDRTDDFTWVLNSPNAIALWDNDTWFLSPAEWQIEAYANWTKVFKTQDDWIEFNKQVTTTQTTPLWDHSLVTKWYVNSKIIEEISRTIDERQWRHPRIDFILYW